MGTSFTMCLRTERAGHTLRYIPGFAFGSVPKPLKTCKVPLATAPRAAHCTGHVAAPRSIRHCFWSLNNIICRPFSLVSAIEARIAPKLPIHPLGLGAVTD